MSLKIIIFLLLFKLKYLNGNIIILPNKALLPENHLIIIPEEYSIKTSISKNSTMSNEFYVDYSTNNNFSNQVQTENVPLYLKILASIFYIISMVLGIGGNTMVLLIFMFYQPVKSVTNFFIINLAISDLIFALLCIPSTYITAYIIQYWPFSAPLCVLFNYMQTASVTLTVYTLIWITLDKFWALVKPLKLRMSIKVCKYLIFFSWLFSLFICIPISLVTKLTPHTESGQASNHSSMNNISYENDDLTNYPQCSEIWPQHLSHLGQLYNISLFIIQYFIPLVILSYCYAKIGYVLKKAKTPGESNQSRDEKMTKSKKKVVF